VAVTADQDPFARVAAGEAFVGAACAAVAAWVPNLEDELHALAAAHVAAAARLQARPRRWLKQLVTLQAALAAAVRNDLGALVWLRRQQQRLVDAYMALEGSANLAAVARLRLRRELVPAAFDRFSRVDRWIMMREEQGAYA
jgi:hypothetical protein